MYKPVGTDHKLNNVDTIDLIFGLSNTFDFKQLHNHYLEHTLNVWIKTISFYTCTRLKSYTRPTTTAISLLWQKFLLRRYFLVISVIRNIPQITSEENRRIQFRRPRGTKSITTRATSKKPMIIHMPLVA